MNLVEGSMFVRNARHYIDLFGETLFEKALEPIDLKKFTKREDVIENSGLAASYDRAGYPVIRRHYLWPFTEEKVFRSDVWTRQVEKWAIEYLVPCPYQNEEWRLLHSILEMQFHYLKNFGYMANHLDNGMRDEIYIYTENDHIPLYTPHSRAL